MKVNLQQVPTDVILADEKRLDDWLAFWIKVGSGLTISEELVHRYLFWFAGSDWGWKRSYFQT